MIDEGIYDTENDTRGMFYFLMWNLKSFNIYIGCSQEKKIMFFQYRIKKFWLKYFNLKG